MKQQVQLNYALQILETYSPPAPFHVHLKQFFRKHKQFGSRDRRLYSSLCYHYFRTGHSLDHLPAREALVYAHFLVSSQADPFLDFWLREFSQLQPDDVQLPLAEKSALLEKHVDFNLEHIFPYTDELMEEIDAAAFIRSLLVQPWVWIRIRKEEKKVREEIVEKGWEPMVDEGQMMAFPQDLPLTQLKSYGQGWFDIQDRSSQMTAKMFNPKPGEFWWDCCAGSGGKSLLIWDMQPDIHLYATDIRENILSNYKTRMMKAGVKPEKVLEADLTKDEEIALPKFDGIILDAPCTGSGTWARNSERLRYFELNEIEQYAKLQQKLLERVQQFLNPGKPIIYITCSVFKKENSEVIGAAGPSLTEESRKAFPGYDKRSDSLFASRLSTP
ncbi:MAG: RsmB/NOP family class I SAM-dependent RNA methyltransferase [Bacteroidia bacterium]